MGKITLDELLALEHAGWESLCESRGGSFYGRLMTPDGVFVLVNGAIMTRDQVAGSLDGAPAWDSFEISDARLIDLGDQAAALVYRSSSSRSDLTEPFVGLMSSVYRRVDGELRLAVYQQTRVAS